MMSTSMMTVVVIIAIIVIINENKGKVENISSDLSRCNTGSMTSHTHAPLNCYTLPCQISA